MNSNEEGDYSLDFLRFNALLLPKFQIKWQKEYVLIKKNIVTNNFYWTEYIIQIQVSYFHKSILYKFKDKVQQLLNINIMGLEVYSTY